jgi:hypothetical protein
VSHEYGFNKQFTPVTDFCPEMKLNSQSVLMPLTADASHALVSPTLMATVAPSPHILPTQQTPAF